MKRSLCAASALLLFLLVSAPHGLAESILFSLHNLSSSGPGEPGVSKATDQDQVCVFCHVPHHSAQPVPLWSRPDPDSIYIPYSSPGTGLGAAPGQPQGGSRLCLSCHDGSIALGMLASGPISTLGALPAGHRANLANLNADLSDDHPISFPYTATLAENDGELAFPAELPGEFKLEHGVNLECRTCHDPHNNAFGKFLVKSNEASGLCVTCHLKGGWATATHAVDAMAAPACANCHLPHHAGGSWLTKGIEEETCLVCHRESGGAADIETLVLNVNSAHRVITSTGVHTPSEDPIAASPHVECSDCHNPHAANNDAPVGPGMVSGRNRNVKGVGALGELQKPASYEYEICFRCHAQNAFDPNTDIPRQIQQVDQSQRFSDQNPSFHPVLASRNAGIPGLKNPDPLGIDFTSDTVITCTDCHNSNQGKRGGGGGPDGPHGSDFAPLLIAEYQSGDGLLPYVPDNFALCFRCHDPLALYDNSISGFVDQHRKHVQQRGISCSVCHDPHGIPWQDVTNPSNHERLINFDTDVVTDPAARFDREQRNCYVGTCHSGNATKSY